MIKLSRGDDIQVVDGDNGSDDAAAEEADRGEVRVAQAVRISSLPLLLEGHTPVGEGLPIFLLRLATEVGDGCCRCDQLGLLRFCHASAAGGSWFSPPFAGRGRALLPCLSAWGLKCWIFEGFLGVIAAVLPSEAHPSPHKQPEGRSIRGE